MAGYSVSVEIAPSGSTVVNPSRLVISHHRSGAAQVEMASPTGTHYLHVAVAMSIFNDMLGLAFERGIKIDSLRVTADGGFAGDTYSVSSGITYSIDIESPAPRSEIDSLIEDVVDEASIPRSIERGTPVQLGEVRVNIHS